MAVTIVHNGPDATIGTAYTRIFSCINEKKYSPILATREVHHKGPGMIFWGNPEKYVTEIQILLMG